MAFRASFAAPANPGLLRAIRPSCTMQSSSATDETASITSSVGSSRSRCVSIGRASILPARPSAQAAATATGLWRSSSKSTSSGTTCGCGRTHRQATERTCASSCRRRTSEIVAGRKHPRRTAARTASNNPGPWTTPFTMMRSTAAAASGAPISAKQRKAAICSGTARSRPKPLKRPQSASSAGMAAISLRRPASAHKARQSAKWTTGRAVINAASSRLPGTSWFRSAGVTTWSSAASPPAEKRSSCRPDIAE